MINPDSILPAVGQATRMRGLPKFLLPCDSSGSTLIERHVYSLLEWSEFVWIPTRPEYIGLLQSLGFPTSQVVLLSMNTQSMIETVGRVISVSGSDRFIMGMPDTFFYGDSPYRLLSEADGIARLALWKIRPEQIGKLGQVKTSESTGEVIDVQDKNPNCTYEYSWGAMSFSRTAFDLADESMTTLGDIIPKLIETKNRVTSALIEGVYYDCGTPLEYYSMLANTVDND